MQPHPAVSPGARPPWAECCGTNGLPRPREAHLLGARGASAAPGFPGKEQGLSLAGGALLPGGRKGLGLGLWLRLRLQAGWAQTSAFQQRPAGPVPWGPGPPAPKGTHSALGVGAGLAAGRGCRGGSGLQDQGSVTRSPGVDAGKAAPAVCGASVSSAGLASAWSVPRPLGMGCLAPGWGGGALASTAPAALRAEPSLLQTPLPWERLETSGASAQKLGWGAHTLCWGPCRPLPCGFCGRQGSSWARPGCGTWRPDRLALALRCQRDPRPPILLPHPGLVPAAVTAWGPSRGPACQCPGCEVRSLWGASCSSSRLRHPPLGTLLRMVVIQSLSRVRFCDPVDCSTPGLPVLHHSGVCLNSCPSDP